MLSRSFIAATTAVALLTAPVSAAHAQTPKKNQSGLSASVSKQADQISSQGNKTTKKGAGDNESSSILNATGDPTQDFFIDAAFLFGIWVVLGSLYGSVIAPNLPHFSLIGLLPH